MIPDWKFLIGTIVLRNDAIDKTKEKEDSKEDYETLVVLFQHDFKAGWFSSKSWIEGKCQIRH